MNKKKCILIGNGPSLNNIDISKLRDIDTISFNRAYISYSDWDFYPTYYCAIDGNTIRCTQDAINKLISDDNGIKKVFVNNAKDEFNLTKCDKLSEFKGFSKSLSEKSHGEWSSSIPQDITTVPLITNVTAFSVQLAYMLGYTDVGIVGTDARYVKRPDAVKDGVYESGPLKGQARYKFTQDKDPNHYRTDYHGQDHLTSFHHINSVSGNELEPWHQVARIDKKMKNFNVYSCTDNSRMNGIIKYVKFDDFMKE